MYNSSLTQALFKFLLILVIDLVKRTLHRGPVNVTPLSEVRGCGPEAKERMEMKRTPIKTLSNLGRIVWPYIHLERDYDGRNDTMRSPWWTQLNPTQELPI